MKIKKLFTMTVSSVLLASVLMLTGIMGITVSYASEIIGGIEYDIVQSYDGRDYYILVNNATNLALELNKSTRILETGMSGDDVVLLQMLLHNMRYVDFAPDGVFDERTEAAVKDFQLGNALGYSSGKADEKTKKQFLLDSAAYKGSPLYERNMAAVAKNGWILDGGKYYYYIDGTMQVGFVQDGGKYYYFKKTTGTMKTGWVQDGGRYYYFSKTDGSMQTGWVRIGGKYYYFKPSTGAMKTGWLRYGGNYYYLSPSTGNPVTGKQKINGKTYKFNSKGICIG